MTSTTSSNILRVGLGVTFAWIGVLILRDPAGWGSIVQPWAVDLIGSDSLRGAMLGRAVLDILIGLALLTDFRTFRAAALGFIHVVTVIVVVGITGSTVRDIAIVAGLLALMADTWPPGLAPWRRGQ